MKHILQAMLHRIINRKHTTVLAVAAVLFIAGVSAIAIGLAAQKRIPPLAVTQSTTSQKQPAPSTAIKHPATSVLPFSVPVSLSIPAIDLNSKIIQVGQNDDGSIQVPAMPHFDNAAWYKNSPAPGQYGASVIIGHVDNYKTGASVFFNLTKLHAGDTISVRRADNKTVTFSVTAVAQYSKDNFPTKTVYTSNNAAELHLITCGGDFNRASGHYDDNIVVFAALAADFKPRS